MNKYNTTAIVFIISFKLVTFRALVRYDPPFFQLKTSTAMAIPAVPLALALALQ